MSSTCGDRWPQTRADSGRGNQQVCIYALETSEGTGGKAQVRRPALPGPPIAMRFRGEAVGTQSWERRLPVSGAPRSSSSEALDRRTGGEVAASKEKNSHCTQDLAAWLMEEAALNSNDEVGSSLGVWLGNCVGSPWGGRLCAGCRAGPAGAEWLCYSQGWESEFCSSS